MADRALHIGVDGRELAGHPTGVGNYLLGLLREWCGDAAFRHRLTIWLPGAVPESLEPFGDRFSTKIEAAPSAGTWWEQRRLPASVASTDVDVFFSPGYTAPLRLRVPSVVAVHDVSYFAHPEWFTWREGRRRRWLTRASARRAQRVVTISEFSAGEIVRWLGIPRDRVDLAPPGAPRVQALAHDRARDPLVLFVGSLFNRRNIPALIDGFARAASRVAGARLVLAGDNRTSPAIDPIALARAHDLERSVEWRAFVSDDELAGLYSSARAFAFLSSYEGFAMTPLEALAHGVPSVLLDTPVAREVYRDAARLVPLDPAAIGHALTELLTNDTAHRELIAAGRGLLTHYTWRRAAAAVRESLERAAASR